MAPDEVDIRYMSDLARLLEERCRSVSLAEVLRVIGQLPPQQVRYYPPSRRERHVAMRLELPCRPWGLGGTSVVLWSEPTPEMKRIKGMLRRLMRREDVWDVLLVTRCQEHWELAMDLAGENGWFLVAVVKEEEEEEEAR